ncbi:DUF732 domain-containing protein [Rhodococcus sp. X156]|uniref:DUF732 domain-containing protein n=1 Tax=Rhodococcus sp. X156 TaxID=2499145 RepID=UPI000FD9FDB2|nr:DUF732 domain-containing protein [Rhodococcus sp. X156]
MARKFMLGAMVAATAVALTAGCGSDAPAEEPLPPVSSSTTTPTPPAPTSEPTTSPAVTPAPQAAATPSPVPRATTTAPVTAAPPPVVRSPSSIAQVPLDTKLYPPPEVPRSSGTTPSKSAYLDALQKGGLTPTATGATELTIGQAVCDELGRGANIADMKKLLVPAGALAAGLAKSTLSGDQVAQLYIDSATSTLCGSGG